MLYTIKDLKNRKTIIQGQADDLKIEEKNKRVWLSRVDNTISIEEFKDGKWEIVAEY